MMLTRCPTCSTAFRVTPEQLKARAGKVRCGHCKAVFNALESLEDAPPVAEAAPPPPSDSEPVPAAATEAGLLSNRLPPTRPCRKASRPNPPLSRPERSRSRQGPSTSCSRTSRQRKRRRLTREEAPTPGPWPLLLALALAAGAGRLCLPRRAGPLQPDWRPQLEELCSQLGCDIPLPRKTDLVSIEASDLHPDSQQKNLLVLAATLKNRATFVQEYPHLEVTLTDTRDQPMLRRVFAPAEYLAEGANVRAGFAANGDLAVNLWLDAGDIGASGYRLYLFYP